MMEVSKETRGGIYLTIEEVAPHDEEPVEIVMNDQVFYHAGDLAIAARLDAGVGIRQGTSGPGTRPDNGGDANKENHGEDDPMEVRSDIMSEFDLGALERDMLEYDFSETEGGGANETLVLMTLSSFMSPTKEPQLVCHPWSLCPWSKLVSQSARRRKIDETMRVAFLGTLPEEEWERYQSELETKTGEFWTRAAFMESTWSIIRRYGTQSVMRVGLNQPIMREVIEKMMESTESDGLTESVTEESAEESPIMRGRSVRRARKGLKKYKSMVRKLKERVNDKVNKPKVVKATITTAVKWLAKLSRPNEAGQGDAQGGRENENQVPPMLLAGLISTASKVKRNERTLADSRLEMEVIGQCGSGGLDDYKDEVERAARRDRV